MTISAATIETKFSDEIGKAQFPVFCNSIIALEGPRTSTFPNFASKPGPDGGIDGQWNLPDLPVERNCAVAHRGWNVYQFKSVDVAGLGREKAFRELCNRAKGAISGLVKRLEVPGTPALYILFTNLQLGIDRPTTTKDSRHLNEQTAKLRAALLHDAPAGIEIEIFDAGKMEGMIARHRGLRLIWFAERAGLTWDEAHRREVNQWQIDAPLKGREADLKQLDAWLSDDAVRVIALTGPNSIGKTRLGLESTKQIAPVTFFVDDTTALIKDDVATLATSQRPVVIVVEDPSHDHAERLARQALSSDQPVKLLMTISSQKEIPSTVFGDAARVQTRHIGPLNSESARQLLEAANSDLDSRARDWILLQAAGNPGCILAAAKEGKNLRRSAETLRQRLTQSFEGRLETCLGSEALIAASILSPLVYVRIDDPAELQVLIDMIAPTQSLLGIRRQIRELESFGCIRLRGETAAVVPPMFAAGLLRKLIRARSDLPSLLFTRLSHDGRKRLLERLVTVELPEDTPFWNALLQSSTENVSSGELNQQLELLEYLARAAPRVVVSFLGQELDNVLRLIETVGHGENLDRLNAILSELLDDTDTGATAFNLLTRLAVHNATRRSGRPLRHRSANVSSFGTRVLLATSSARRH